MAELELRQETTRTQEVIQHKEWDTGVRSHRPAKADSYIFRNFVSWLLKTAITDN